ncbi:GPP34 family phosphoprotein [Citricoccus sp. I39-566]|uniref:GPP34 family phosphoprotein n=1 Tax=Citricoccus sp. I39-566 TaxID=3073268 RepID=UPI00286B748E|nr:GPP34 family phosphoprotein [Citricoccus sp. I39-566]WMY79595.1 GPP34 family phosphoprotein [Citricoccus sp. I39-566]
MLIVEEMFLLLSQDNAISDRAHRYRRYGLAAAALADLADTGVVQIADAGTPGGEPKVTVVKAGMTGRAPLDALLPALDGLSGKKISALVAHAKLDPEQATGQELARQGIVREESSFLGGSSFLTVNPAPAIALRERLGQVLSGDREPTPAESTELGLLKALNVAHGVLGPARGDLDRRGLSRRIDAVAQGIPVVEAVQRVVDPITASTMTVTTAAGSARAT